MTSGGEADDLDQDAETSHTRDRDDDTQTRLRDEEDGDGEDEDQEQAEKDAAQADADADAEGSAEESDEESAEARDEGRDEKSAARDEEEEESAARVESDKSEESEKAESSDVAAKDAVDEDRAAAKHESAKSGDAPATKKKKAVESSAGRKGKRREKKSKTTSSQMIRAITATGEHAAVAEDFFKADAYETKLDEDENWDDLKESAEPMSEGAQKYKRFTIGVVSAAVVLFSGWMVYHKLVMPTPAPLGAVAPELPTIVEPADRPVVAEVVEEAPPEEALLGEEGLGEEGLGEEGLGEEGLGEEATPEEATPTEPAGDYATLLAEAQALRGNRAIDGYRAAIAADPNGVEALADLAFILLNRGNNAEAADLAGRATAIDPTNSKGWITLGAARQGLRDNAGAREAYQACVDRGEGRYVSDCRAML
jgi:hypothetical protein